jgi:hypothetical protein
MAHPGSVVPRLPGVLLLVGHLLGVASPMLADGVSIGSVTPACGERGSTATILGRGFGGPNVRVTVGNVAARILSATGALATFEVPAGAPPGPTTVTAQNPGGHSASIDFRVGCDAGPVDRIEIRPAALVLAGVGDFRDLVAVAYGAQGNVLNVAFRWTSSRSDAIAVDENGRVTALVANGSAQIVAEAGGVSSVPLLAIATVVPTGTILLTDAQIVGDPFDTDPQAEPDPGNTYRVVLTGVTPPPLGSLILNTEGKPVGGRVVEVEDVGGHVTVTLRLVALTELLPDLTIDEVIDLSRAAVVFPPELAASYDIVRDGDTITFTPRSSGAGATPQRALGPIGTTALGPFSCEGSITGAGTSLPISLGVPPVVSVSFSPTVDLVYTSANGLERLVFNGEPSVKLEAGVIATLAFEGKLECKLRLFDVVFPIAGPVWAVLPVGAGMELGGKFTVASMGVKSTLEGKALAKLGVACPPLAGCGVVNQLSNSSLKFNPTIDLNPGIGDLRVEPAVSLFGTVDVELGPPVLSSLRFKLLKTKAGGKLQGSFAPRATQIADAAYQSDYKVSFEAGAGAGPSITSALNLLGITGFSILEVSFSTDLSRSPTGSVTADKDTFIAGDTVNFQVKLDLANVNFLSFYNVDRVLLVRSVGGASAVVDTIFPGAVGVTQFDFAFLAPDSGTASQFYAFVITKALPFDILSLEIGQAKPPVTVSVSPQTVTLAPGGTRQFTATVTGSSNTAVSWSATCGSVNTTGLYTAPGSTGSCTVRATSVADASVSGTATVTVAASAVQVSVSPASTSLLPGGTRQFTATVTGTANTAVTWTATCGTVSPTGLFTAPATEDLCEVRATSVADPSAFGTATVSVVLASPIVVIGRGSSVKAHANGQSFVEESADVTDEKTTSSLDLFSQTAEITLPPRTTFSGQAAAFQESSLVSTAVGLEVNASGGVSATFTPSDQGFGEADATSNLSVSFEVPSGSTATYAITASYVSDCAHGSVTLGVQRLGAGNVVDEHLQGSGTVDRSGTLGAGRWGLGVSNFTDLIGSGTCTGGFSFEMKVTKQ